jgi:tetratricopeptide (TPR) repeat protein
VNLVAAILHNMGNLESAAGNYLEATELFNRAVKIRDVQGETAANQLALLYLCIGRNYFWQRKYDDAMKSYAKAENLFVRTLGADKHYMAQ